MSICDECAQETAEPIYLCTRCYARLMQEERKLQMEKDSDIAADHDCKTWSECCDCRGEIAKAIRKAFKEDQQ